MISCKQNKKPINSNKIIHPEIKKNSPIKNILVKADNVTLEIYTPNDDRIENKPMVGFIINIEKTNPYIKYSRFSKNLSRSSMKDSVLLIETERKHIHNFFLPKNTELKETYWDSSSEGRVRKIYFLEKNKAIVKNVKIIGEPKNINYLKESCDFLFEKIRIKDSIR